MTITLRRALTVVLVLGAACGSVTGGASDAAGDASAGDVARDVAPDVADTAPDLPATGDGGDSDAVSDAAPDAPSTCPAEIASCAAAFLALKSQCPGAGVACTEQTLPPDMINRCYANGVRVYFSPGGTTVLKADGRVCYSTVDVVSGQVVDSTIKDPMGTEIIRITHTLGAPSDYFTCGADFVEIPEGQQPCGDLDSLPAALQCETGPCVRP
jgi:hypothetical protein